MAPLTLLLPVFNKAAVILLLLERVAKNPYHSQILVVNDGSSDGTAEAVEEWARKHAGQREITVLRHAVNRGKGAAIRTGFLTRISLTAPRSTLRLCGKRRHLLVESPDTSVSTKTPTTMRQLTNTAVRLLLIAGLLIAAQHQAVGAQEEVAAAVRDEVPNEHAWSQVPPSARERILKLLSAQTRSNYERIKTWVARYSIHTEGYLSPAFVANAFPKRLPEWSTPALIKEQEEQFQVAIDMASDSVREGWRGRNQEELIAFDIVPGSVFRESDTTKFRFLTTDTRKPVEIRGTAPVDLRSIVTSEHYVYFPYKDPPGTYGVLPDHPEAKNKRAAHRVSWKQAARKHHAELMDPRLFFCCSTPSMFWDEADMFASMLRGERGPEKQQNVSDNLRIDKAVVGNRTWYRIQNTPSQKSLVTEVWSPLVGYNPVSLIWVSKADGVVRKSVSWQWRSVDGIFVPATVSEVWHPEQPGNVDTYRRTVQLKDCSLNEPLRSDQFSYRALGLGTGDLILDEIQQAVYIMDSRGRAKRLAAFHQPYSPLQLATGRNERLFLIAVSLAVLSAAIFAAYFWNRARRSS